MDGHPGERDLTLRSKSGIAETLHLGRETVKIHTKQMINKKSSRAESGDRLRPGKHTIRRGALAGTYPKSGSKRCRALGIRFVMSAAIL